MRHAAFLPPPTVLLRVLCGYGFADEGRRHRRAKSFKITHVTTSLQDREIEKRPTQVKLQGRILLLTEDPELIKRQLAGEDLPWDAKNPANNPKLRDDISTDEITPRTTVFISTRPWARFPTSD